MALFDLMIDGTGKLGVRSPRCGLCTFSCLFPPFASSASYDAPPFIFSEEPYTIRGSTNHIFYSFLRKGIHRIYCATDGSWKPGYREQHQRVHGIYGPDAWIRDPSIFFYQIYLRLTSHALVPLLPSSWFPLWFSLFRALLSSRADHKRHSK